MIKLFKKYAEVLNYNNFPLIFLNYKNFSNSTLNKYYKYMCTYTFACVFDFDFYVYLYAIAN